MNKRAAENTFTRTARAHPLTGTLWRLLTGAAVALAVAGVSAGGGGLL